MNSILRTITNSSILLLISINAYSQCDRLPFPYPIKMPDCDNGIYNLVFEDNFNGNSLNLTKWELQGWGQGTLTGDNRNQIYTTESDNLKVSNGTSMTAIIFVFSRRYSRI